MLFKVQNFIFFIMDHAISEMYKGSFSYKDNNITIIVLNNSVKMRVERVDEDIAKIYFVNSQDNAVPVPNGIIIRILITNAILPPQHNAEYYITWFSNYMISYNGEE